MGDGAAGTTRDVFQTEWLEKPMNDTSQPNKPDRDAANTDAGVTRWGVWLAIFALVGGLAGLLWHWSNQSPRIDREPPKFSGEFNQFIPSHEVRPAPQTGFAAGDGRAVTLADWWGKVVLVNFWATDCVTCVKEMPEIVSTYNKFRDRGFETIAVAMRHDPPNYVLNYTEKNRLPFKVALDPLGDLAKSFGEVKLTPTTFVIDKQGNVVTRILGEPDFAKLHALLEQKLGET